MQIKNQKDFWAGLMFIGFGLFAVLWALTHYQMGTAVRMGPGYFPVMLGGLLAVLGAVVFLEAILLRPAPDATPLQLPFSIIDLAIFIGVFVVLSLLARWTGIAIDFAMLGGAAVVSLLAIRYRPDAKALVLISASCVAYGYLMKPLGLVVATIAVVFISAFGGHEFKWREVAILSVLLVLFSVIVFVKGLTLPFPICPQFVDICPIR